MSKKSLQTAAFVGLVGASIAGLVSLDRVGAGAATGGVSPNSSCNSSSPCLQWTNGTGVAISGTSAGSDGLVGLSKVNNHSGVVGRDTASGTGVTGTSNNGTGVMATSASGIGLFATSQTNEGVAASTAVGPAAIEGWTTNNSATTNNPSFGVYGFDFSSDAGTLNIGVFGLSKNGIGVAGASNGGGTAVSGNSQNGVGVLARSGSSFAFEAKAWSGNVQVPVLAISGVTGNAFADVIEAFDSSGTELMRLTDTGDLAISGQIFTAGPCSVGCIRQGPSERRVVRYTPEESIPTMEDVGEAQLANGSAYVPIDGALGNVIDKHSNYLVFITPQGETQGNLYVTGKTSGGFWVKENQGGHSTVPFDYRIVAKPYGAPARRLPMITVKRAPR